MGNVKISTGLANALARGDSLKALLTDYVLQIFSGSVPNSADDAETGTLLVTITTDGNSWSASTKQVSTFDITDIGDNGDTLTVTISPVNPSGSNEIIQYTKSASESTKLEVAQAVASLINSNSVLTRAMACNNGSNAAVIVESKYAGDSFSMTAVASGNLTVGSVSDLVANSRGNGLHFEGAQGVADGILQKADDTWKGTVVASGTASYFRLKANGDAGGQDAAGTYKRIQGTVGTLSDSPLQLSGSSTLTQDTTITIGSFSIQVPLANA